MNICVSSEAGIEGAIHTVREQEDPGMGETWEEIWERPETEDQARLRVELECKSYMIESGRSLATILEDREVEKEAKESELENKEGLAEYLKDWEDGIFVQAVQEEMEVN